MRITAVCPNCQKRIPTRFTWNSKRKDLRRCDHCESLLFRVNTDRQPWSLLILVVAIGPLMLLSLLALFFLADLGWMSLSLIGLGLLWLLAFDYWQTPYTNGYVAWHPSCKNCGYDMRESRDKCPECGGSATRHPEAVTKASDSTSVV